MNYAALLAAIIAVETPNGEMVGDGGRAVGRTQCHPIMVREINRLCGTQFKVSERKARSEEMFLALARYLHIERGFSVKQIAQVWNAGLDGPGKGQALKYAAKVERLYAERA